MTDGIKFECPRCEREYQLSVDLDTVRQKNQRAKCARCGERFEIATRVDAFRARLDVASADAEIPSEAELSSTQMAALAVNAWKSGEGLSADSDAGATQQSETGQSAGSVAAGDAEKSLAPTDAGARSDGDFDSASTGPSTVQVSNPLLDPVAVSPAHASEQVLPLPATFDWLAHAGAGFDALRRDLEPRERELVSLLLGHSEGSDERE